MYIVTIAWLFTATLIAISQTSLTAGVLSFCFWGLLPLLLTLWLVGTPARLRNKARKQDESAASSDQLTPDQ